MNDIDIKDIIKDELVDFLRDNLKIKISKETLSQYNDYEYSEKLEVKLYLETDFCTIEIDSDYIPIDRIR
ncbi:MAG: hypothetical protein ACRDB0_05130 [Paraclostridium sp.]